MNDLFVARQPIYDKSLAVFGYELLYRSGDIEEAVFTDGSRATSETILNSFMEIGIDRLVGSAQAFINFPEKLLVGDSFTPILAEQSVLEILEDTRPTEEVIEGIKRLKEKGYKIALDDFQFKESLRPLLALADFVKIDVLALDESQIIKEIKYLKDYDLKLIAEKIETQEMKALCVDYGFDYFQGFFFCKPQLVKQKLIPTNKVVALNLLNKIQDPSLDYEEFQVILSQDVSLTYKLLRYINSAMFSLRREIESIKDAVVLLGQDNVKKWLSLILLSRMDTNKPNELIVVALIRGRMCELLAEELHPEVQPQMFIIGLFSVLDALMDVPMVDLLDTVILSTPIKLALLDQEGEQGEILDLVFAYEQFKFKQLVDHSIATDNLRNYYLESVQWTEQAMKALN